MQDLSKELLAELQGEMSLHRIAQVGFFIQLDRELEIDSELKLHRAVLDKALVDSMLPTHKFYYDDEEQKVFPRLEVDRWLKIDNKEFVDACERAHLEPKFVFKAFEMIKKVLVGDRAKFTRIGRNPTKKVPEPD